MNKKMQPACKPGPVLRPKLKCLPFILSYRHRQALAVYPPASDEQSYIRRYTWPYNP